MFTLLNNENLKRENLYEQIANSIEQQIIESPELIGECMPSEQTVADSYGVSRNVMREAFKVLKERGFIEVRNGACAYITRPNSENVRNALTRLVRTDSSRVSEIFEVRYALELSAASLTAMRGDEADIAECETLIQHMMESENDPALWAEYDYRFHRKIVEATGNSLFLTLYESLSIPVKELFERAWGNERARHDGLVFHSMLLEAFKERAADKAQSLMSDHLAASRREMEEYFSRKGDN